MDEVQPLEFPNLMYTFHFYAASHASYMPMFREQTKRLPIFATEWGTCTNTGDGYVDIDQSNQWLAMLNGNNPGGQKISWCNWSYGESRESCAGLNPYSCSSRQWASFSKSGNYVVSQFK